MKNSTSVAGTALAMPLSRNTASRRRKPGVRQGADMSARGRVWACAGAWSVAGMPRVAGRGAHAAPAIVTASKPANTAVETSSPATDGSTLATSTPTSARASRQLTMRARWASSPPRRAPQAWWITDSTL